MTNFLFHFRAFSFSALLIALVCGCGTTETPSAESTVAKPVPKQRFHLPKTYPKGVARIRELFDVVSGEGELPEPISYQVREIIHGTGAAAHSHFHLLENTNNEDQVFDDDGHETTGEKTHTIVVDWSTELSDLALRLPKIAVGGDIDEQTWVKVRDLSSTLSEEFEALSSHSTDETRRDSIRKKSKVLEQLIVKLESYLTQPAVVDSNQ